MNKNRNGIRVGGWEDMIFIFRKRQCRYASERTVQSESGNEQDKVCKKRFISIYRGGE